MVVEEPLAEQPENKADTENRGDFSLPECPACWTALRFTDKYCSWCGEPQPLRTLPYKKVCLHCATQLPQRANYCHTCGHESVPNPKRNIGSAVELFNEDASEFPTFEA
jgi:predicted amidophosphoribosyltransferase